MNLGKETETLEFKKTTGEMKQAMISISSILNKHGVGTLYFGVKPSGDVVGQDVSESSLRDVSRSVYENIRPQIYPVIDEVILDGKHLIRWSLAVKVHLTLLRVNTTYGPRMKIERFRLRR